MKIWKPVMAVFVVGAAVGISYYWMTNRPRAERRPVEKKARLVDTISVTAREHDISVHAMGTVIPRENVEVVARVNGQLTHVNPDLIPGSHIDEGELLARIDKSDYRLDVQAARQRVTQTEQTCVEREMDIRRAEYDVQRAETDLALERARQAVARNEYELLSGMSADDGNGDGERPDASKTPERSGSDLAGVLRQSISGREKRLILREPQLIASKAALNAAKAARRKAESAYQRSDAACEESKTALELVRLKLEWTTIESPFNAVVRIKNVGRGSYVSQGHPVATLVNTDTYWVELSVPVAKLKWIHFPEDDSVASVVRIYHTSAWGEEQYRQGRVLRMEPGVEKDGRMAKVVVAVDDPRCRKPENASKPELLLDSYVEAEISGRVLKDAVKISRSTLRDGNKVWIMSGDSTLEIRDVQVAARTPEYVYVTDGLETGEQLVTSTIPSAVEGMSLTTE